MLYFLLIFFFINNVAEHPVFITILSESSLVNGKTIYQDNCLVCHLKDGKGIEGVYPPLTDKVWLQKPDEILIDIVLNGQKGPITVSGKPYNFPMTPFSYLSDQEIAAVINYIRLEFGGIDQIVQPEQVAALRKKKKAK
jgi:nitrite reductase (NO-forming)